MSFLAFDDKSPTTNATFKALKAEEFLYKDPESGTYIPLCQAWGRTTLLRKASENRLPLWL
jgi:hypothetical protein